MVPTREYWANPGQTVKTNGRMKPETSKEVVDNIPVKEDWENNLEAEEHKAKRKVYNEQVLAWKENKAKY